MDLGSYITRQPQAEGQDETMPGMTLTKEI